MATAGERDNGPLSGGCVGPAVGEHTEAVLAALGYSVAERAQLRQAGTVA